jgi:hypothetical protein
MKQVTEKAGGSPAARGVLRAPAFSWKGGGDAV